MAHAAPSTVDVMIRFAANVVGALCVVSSVESCVVVVVVVVDPESRRKNLMKSAAASLDTHAKFLSMSSIAADDSAVGTPSTFSIVLNFKGNQYLLRNHIKSSRLVYLHKQPLAENSL